MINSRRCSSPITRNFKRIIDEAYSTKDQYYPNYKKIPSESEAQRASYFFHLHQTNHHNEKKSSISTLEIRHQEYLLKLQNCLR